ncbi:MAG: GatB/YqeY domain-containing protein [Betaproteobacteria bacterium]
MALKARITEDMKTAMRAKDAARLSTIRLLLAAIKQREVDERREMADTDVATIIDKMVKQRRDSITQFEAGKRQDLADLEKTEVTILQAYMPQPLSDAAIDAAIAAAIAAVMAKEGATGPSGMGKVMAELKPKLAGRADMTAVSAKVKARLV